MRTLAVSFLCSLLPLAALAADSPKFSEADLRDTIKTLSADAFGGRAPGSQGEKLTLDYITGQYQKYGLTPGNGTSWLQEVPIKQITADPDTTLVVSGGSGPYTFAYGSDMVVSSPRTDAMVSLTKSDL